MAKTRTKAKPEPEPEMGWREWIWSKWKWVSSKRVSIFWAVVGDVRSAMVGGLGGAVVALVSAWYFARSPEEYEVNVNEDGWAQPRSLFEYVEKKEPSLKMDFRPTELKSAYVCEYKLSIGTTWRLVLLSYLDAYRECFDVIRRGENLYVISPNMRSTQMEVRQGAYMCKCQTARSPL
jgi:hypothetical protein